MTTPVLPRDRRITHGCAKSTEYTAWTHMIERCYSPNNKHFSDYGGRGIIVCEQWKSSFANFLADVGLKPSPRHSLDRIDNNGHYEPGNVRWATKTDQTRNRRSTRLVTYQNRTQCLWAWSEELGKNYQTLYFRLNSGWTVERAFTHPVRRRSR